MSAGERGAIGALKRASGVVSATAAVLLGSSAAAYAAPPIRTSAANPVPACVTPSRLMAFLAARNPNVDPRFASIADNYKAWGDAWRVRWDYAFFQMAIETNYLKYRRSDGQRGDVHETQNNFAGIGATGRGAPGDRFSDVSTGVHAQIQHLVAYSGERLARPIAPRTTLKQDDIVELSQRLNRPVTFGDLARRWAVDRHYARSIDFVAGQFREAYCDGASASSTEAHTPPAPQPAQRRSFPPPAGLGGPKPSALAGPEQKPDAAEVLPWATAPAEPPAAGKSQAQGAQRTGARKPIDPKAAPTAGPARTIWSRKTKTVSERRAAPDVAVAVAANPAPSAPPADEGFLGLPVFRISPSDPPPPSRLGGPVPQLETAKDSPPSDVAILCRVLRASYGGKKTLLVQSTIDGELRLTALTVLDGFEKSMFETYARAAAPGAAIIGEYDSQDAALADARSNCPGS